MSAPLPPSVSAGSHEMRDYYPNQGPPRSAPHTAPSITPYLGLRARLSQIWINRWTILLLLVLARTLIAISGINHDLASARREALSACSSVESIGSAMASMPHFMSQGVNELTATGVEKSVNGLMQMTTLSVTGVEEIVLFVIGMMTNTYLCLITFAVSGSLHALIGGLESAQADLSKSTLTLGNDISSTVGDFTDAFNKAVNALKNVPLVGDSVSFPSTLNLSSQMTQLKNLSLPANLNSDLQKLNDSIPTFAQVKNFTDTAISTPFELVKGLINDNLGNYTFNRSLLAVPDKQQLTFCSDNNGINAFFDELVDLAALARKIFIAVLVGAAVLVIIPMWYREVRRWRKMQQRAQIVGTTDREPLDAVYIISRPYTASAGLKVSRGFDSIRRQTLARWVVAYATSDAALFVLALAVAGFFSCACQAILLKTIEKEVPQLTNQVGDFADKVVNTLNNASGQWAIATNDAVGQINHDINSDMLGWVNTTTGALNDTLNTFVNLTTNVLNDTFGGTPLYEPIMEVLNCLVLMKIEGIEKALTWVSDNAHINFPTLPNDTFSLGAAASIASGSSDPSASFLSAPGNQASDAISGAVETFVKTLEQTLRMEAIIATVILCVWLIVVLIGIVYALTKWFGRDKLRGEGGAAPYYPDAPAPTMAPADFTSDGQDRFVNIPLHDVNSTRPVSPAPQYTESKERPDTAGTERDYQDQKLGFAGHRELHESAPRNVQSMRASVWPLDGKNPFHDGDRF